MYLVDPHHMDGVSLHLQVRACRIERRGIITFPFPPDSRSEDPSLEFGPSGDYYF